MIKLVLNKTALIAQLVEQLPLKEMVVGSIPTESTKNKISNLHFTVLV